MAFLDFTGASCQTSWKLFPLSASATWFTSTWKRAWESPNDAGNWKRKKKRTWRKQTTRIWSASSTSTIICEIRLSRHSRSSTGKTFIRCEQHALICVFNFIYGPKNCSIMRCSCRKRHIQRRKCCLKYYQNIFQMKMVAIVTVGLFSKKSCTVFII